ncbi:MAG: radical SAM protein [Thermoplasmata archaeon]
MEILYRQGDEDVAEAYLAKFEGENEYVEFVDSLGSAGSRKDKWVIIISSMFGCPVKCKFCDGGHFYEGTLTKEQMMEQVDYVVKKRSPSGKIDSDKFKVQFARIGEPSFNDAVLDTIVEIKERYEPKTYMPCISTVAPAGRDEWFDAVADLNNDIFQGEFQLQFSVHSTDEDYRDFLIPIKKMSLEEISEYGERYYSGGRKATLNFALDGKAPIDVGILSDIFDKRYFAVKITPMNPTRQAEKNKLINVFSEGETDRYPVIKELGGEGFDVYLSIGELRENEIKSNCGQVLLAYIDPSEL